MEYKQALKVLRDLTKFGINLGLERIKSLLDHFDNPQEKLKIIHIGGTNGKGSTAAILTAILIEAGYKVGTYTSPHLQSYTERIKINNNSISSHEFSVLLQEIQPIFNKVVDEVGESPTEFEVLTALALIYFQRAGVNIVILEVGMGGDIDSTNVFRNPEVSVITNVSYDHEDYLGKTLEEIASKKSGIIKKARPIVTASTDDRVLSIIRKKADLLGSPLYEIGHSIKYTIEKTNMDGQQFNLQSSKREYQGLFLSLQGEHQLINCATAVQVIEILQDSGWRIKQEDILEGLNKVIWPGRLEVIKRKPLIIIDGAHNPAGMKELAKWLKQNKKQIRGRIVLIIGMLADKNRSMAVKYLDALVDEVIITKPPSVRAGGWYEVKEYFNAGDKEIHLLEDYAEAITKALAIAECEDMIIITGSIYLIGEVRSLFID